MQCLKGAACALHYPCADLDQHAAVQHEKDTGLRAGPCLQASSSAFRKSFLCPSWAPGS